MSPPTRFTELCRRSPSFAICSAPPRCSRLVRLERTLPSSTPSRPFRETLRSLRVGESCSSACPAVVCLHRCHTVLSYGSRPPRYISTSASICRRCLPFYSVSSYRRLSSTSLTKRCDGRQRVIVASTYMYSPQDARN